MFKGMMQAGLGIGLAAAVLTLAALSLSLRGAVVSPEKAPQATKPVRAAPETRTGQASPASHNPILQFSEFYQGGGARGLILSEKLTALNGKRVVMTGFMALPLKPALDFFVLTRVPLTLCPFCASDAQWPEDIVCVRLPPGQTVKPTSSPLQVVGRLDIGTKTDEATGFVSLVRIEAERVTVLH